MYECQSWTIKKAECWRIDAFELWCCRRLLRVPWTARTSNQSILMEINPEYIHWNDWCWSWSSYTLATWCHWKRLWCRERLKTEEEDDREWDGWMTSLTWWPWVWASSGSWWWTGKSGVLQSMESQKVRHNWATELNWAVNKNNFVIIITGAVVLCSMNKGFDQFIYKDNSFNINIWADLHILRKLKWLVSVFEML